MAFKEDANFDDIFKAMLGKFIEPVYLRWPVTEGKVCMFYHPTIKFSREYMAYD